MKTIWCVLLLCASAFAQMKYEATALYSHIYMVPDSPQASLGFNGDALHFNGGGGQFTYNRWTQINGGEGLLVGPKVELFDYRCTRGGNLFTYMAGPQVRMVVENPWRLYPFVHALVGGGHDGIRNGVVMAFGGGIDYQLSPSFGLKKVTIFLRPVMIDYMYSHIQGVQDSVRYSGGLMFTFGK